MNKFVKIKGYPEQYFMLISKAEELPNRIEDSMSERLQRVIGNELMSEKDYKPANMFFERYNYACHNKLDYKKTLDKYKKPLLIRSIGSYMTLSDSHEIEETIYSHDFPSENDNANIVVCENDMNAEPAWLDYLQNKFPDQKIKVLNFFSSRSEESLKKSLKNVEHITFSTTFTNFDWFEKIVRNTTNDKKILGFCHNPEQWEEAKTIACNHNLEIVNSLKA